MTKWRTIVSGYGLLESPVWDGNGLLFSDVTEGGVYRAGVDGEVVTVVPKRRGVGGLMVHVDGGVVVSGRDLSWSRDGETRVVHARPDGGFNDICTDPQGRVIVGQFRGDASDHRPERPGAPTLRIGLAGEVEVLYDDVPYSNGIRCSPDGRLLYHADSATGDVSVAVLDDGTGVDRTTFAHPPVGKPDGIDLDDEGGVWVACFGAGVVIRYSPDGEETDRLEVPALEVTSVGFGGPDRATLYVTTADNREDAARRGTVFATDETSRRGLPLTPARV